MSIQLCLLLLAFVGVPQTPVKSPQPRELAIVTMTGSGTLAFIDIDRAEVVTAVDLAGSTALPTRLAVTPDGRTAVVTSPLGYVATVDLVQRTAVDATLSVGPELFGPTLLPSEFEDVAISPDGQLALVTELNETGQLFFFDIEDLSQPLTPIALGDEPSAIAIKSDGSEIYVLEEGSIHVVLSGGGTDFIFQPALTPEIGHFALTPDETRALFVGSDRWVYLLDTQTPGWNLLDQDQIPGGRFAEPRWVAVSPDGKSAIMANGTDRSISFIAVGPNNVSILGTLDVGGTPHAVAFTPDSRRAVVTVTSTSVVHIVDVATRTIVATVDEGLGLAPTEVAVLDPGRLVRQAPPYVQRSP